MPEIITLPTGTRIWLAAGETDMRCGFQGRAEKVRTALEENPLGGHVFIFRGRRGDLVKLLWATDDGLWLLAKRLKLGRFISSHLLTISASDGPKACCKLNNRAIKRGDVAGRSLVNTKLALIVVPPRSQSRMRHPTQCGGNKRPRVEPESGSGRQRHDGAQLPPENMVLCRSTAKIGDRQSTHTSPRSPSRNAPSLLRGTTSRFALSNSLQPAVIGLQLRGGELVIIRRWRAA